MEVQVFFRAPNLLAQAKNNKQAHKKMNKITQSKELLSWYEAQGRDLPWRVKGGAHPNPYIVFVSEIMLQQTTVKTVIPYFKKFMKRFPDIESLAQASEEEVYKYWQGLGYYSRARSLHEAAKTIKEQGKFPQTREEVLKLKGIGNYTVSSFLALAFNKPETIIDGNVIRIITRLYHLTEPTEKIQNIIRQKAEELTDKESPADYASAIMDLGALICTPKNPQCLLCPWQAECRSRGEADLEAIPYKKQLAKPLKQGNVYIIQNSHHQVFIRKRTQKGLLSGLYEFPWSEEKLFSELPQQDTQKEITHVFTHFKLVLHIYKIQTEQMSEPGQWVERENLSNYPFSTLMKKVERYINF